MDISKLPVYVELAGSLIQIGSGTVSSIRSAMQSHGIEADTAALERLEREYQARIDRRQDQHSIAVGTTGD